MSLLISFLYLCLRIAFILLVAYGIVWLLRWTKIELDANLYKVGQFIVGLLILIAVVVWLSGVVYF